MTIDLPKHVWQFVGDLLYYWGKNNAGEGEVPIEHAIIDAMWQQIEPDSPVRTPQETIDKLLKGELYNT